MTRCTILTLSLAAALIATSGVTLAGPKDRTTIVDIAVGNPDFSTLVAAVVKTGLVDTLNGRRQFTVFAPTNDAFDAAAQAILGPASNGIDLVDALSAQELTDVLLYHVAPGRRYSEDVVESRRIRMMNKDFTFPSVDGAAVFINASEIVSVDIEADNGVIHVIGGVLLPQ